MIASRVSLLTRAGAATAATAIALAGVAVTGSAVGAATHHSRKLPTSLSIRLVKHTRDGFDVIRGQLRSQYFDRDLPPVLEILGKVDHRHPTATELALNRVAAGEGGSESVEDLWQVS